MNDKSIDTQSESSCYNELKNLMRQTRALIIKF